MFPDSTHRAGEADSRHPAAESREHADVFITHRLTLSDKFVVPTKMRVVHWRAYFRDGHVEALIVCREA